MRPLTYLLIIGILGITSTATSHAQWDTLMPLTTACEPCAFPSARWEALPFDSAFVMLDDCSFAVTMKRRVCGTDGCQEVKIYDIEPTEPIPCDAIDDDLIPALVLGKMVITDNGMGFAPDTATPGANGCWRIIRPRCWRKLISPGLDPCTDSLFDEGTFIPCNMEDCCVNVLYPILPNCTMNYVFYEPRGDEYVDIHRRISLPDSLTAEEIYEADITLRDQFLRTDCVECSIIISPPPGEGTISACEPFCKASLLEQYNNAAAELIRRRYK